MPAGANTQIEVAELDIRVKAQIDAAALAVVEYLNKYDKQLQKAASTATKAAFTASKYQTQLNKQAQSAQKLVQSTEKARTATIKRQQAENKLNKEKKKSISNNKQLNHSENSIAKTLKNTVRILASYISLRAIKNGVLELAESFGDAYEASNLFFVSLEGYSDEANELANNLADAWGLPARSIKESIGQLNLLAKSMGLSDKQAYSLSTVLSQLSVDLASLRNLSVEEAMEKIESGLAGNSRPLRDIGIDVTEQRALEVAKAYGLVNEEVRELTGNQKYLARTLAMYEAMKDAGDIGDFSRTMDSLENQTRIFLETWKEIKVTVGTIFSDSFRNFMYYANGVAKAVLIATNAVREMLGIQTVDEQQEEIYYERIKATEEWQQAYTEALNAGKSEADAIQAANKAYADIQKSTENTADNLEESEQTLNNMLGKMDKFNVLSSTSKKEDNTDFDLSQIINLEIPAAKTVEQVEKVKNKILELLGFIQADTGEWVIGKRLQNIIDMLDSIKNSDSLNAIFEKAGNTLENILKLIGKIFGDVGDGIKNSDISPLGKLVVSLLNLVDKIISAIEKVWDKFDDTGSIEKLFNLLLDIVNLVSTIIDGVSQVFDNENFETILNSLGEVVTTILDIVSMVVSAVQWIYNLLEDIGANDYIENYFLKELKEVIRIVEQLFNNIAAGFECIGALFSGDVEKMEDALENLMYSLLRTLGTLVSKIVLYPVNQLIDAINSVIEGVGHVFGADLKNVIPNIPTDGNIPFANGGIVYGEVNGATLGEYRGARRNPEIIAPLDDLRGIMKAELEEMIVNGNLTADKYGRNDKPVEVTVKVDLDGKEISRNQVPIDNKTAKQRNRETLTRRGA